MTNTDLLHAMGNIDPSLIAAAAPDITQRKTAGKAWLKWGGIAAGLCLFATAALRISVAFVPNHATDPYSVGEPYEIESVYDLPAEYDGKLLLQNLDLSDPSALLYYNEGGDPTNTEDWYSLILSDRLTDGKLVMFCMFGDTGVEDWKVSMVFTKKATRTLTVNGVEVQIAPNVRSLEYEYWYYAIFEYDDVVYDVRVQSNDPDAVYEVLEQLLKE